MRYNHRIISIYIIFTFLFLGVSSKIFYLQIFKGKFFQDLAKNQHYRLLPLEGKRGNIFDRKERVLATSISCYSIFADPLLISDKAKTACVLSANLDLSEEDLRLKLIKGKRFVWVKRKITWQKKEEIKALKLEGVGFIREEKRFYPQDGLSASVLGIAGIDNKGLEGLEAYYNNYLSGKDGWARVLQDSTSREIMLSSQVITPQRGADMVLTIDAQIQYWVEKYLEETIEKFNAKQGSVVVMDATNGEILALANMPSFNPNDLGKVTSNQMRNIAVADMFEPGSVFKVVTLLTAIDDGRFSNADVFDCEKGLYKIPGTVLHDWRPYGELSFEEVFMKSSNIGIAKINEAIGPEPFFKNIKKLEFGQLTGIDLPGEVEGSIKPLGEWSKTSKYIIPIGQEIGVNLLQLARTFAVIANGGYLVQPHVVKSICSLGYCKDIQPRRKQVFSSVTTERAKKILFRVVGEGTGKSAQVKERSVGGKTGTAQKFDPKINKYSPDKYRATFVGFIGDIDPPLVIGVTVDEPTKSHFGGVVAAPVFGKVAKEVIKYREGESALVKQTNED